MKLRSLVSGFVLGFLFGAASVAVAARLVGDNGYLFGWTVTVEGREVCHDPYVWVDTREIECD